MLIQLSHSGVSLTFSISVFFLLGFAHNAFPVICEYFITRYILFFIRFFRIACLSNSTHNKNAISEVQKLDLQAELLFMKFNKIMKNNTQTSISDKLFYASQDIFVELIFSS